MILLWLIPLLVVSFLILLWLFSPDYGSAPDVPWEDE